MKKVEFNNIEENKFVMGYIHYKNSKNKIVYKKAIGYIIPEEDLVFCMSSYNFGTSLQAIKDLAFEKVNENNNLYFSINDNTIFELKKYIYPESNKKISIEALMELIPLLEKYVLDEDFELNEELEKEYNINSGKQLKKEIKQLMSKKVVSV